MMDMKAAMAVLEESQGSNVNSIYIPSFGKELAFKPLTTGQQKSISKFALDAEEGYDIDEEFLKLALFDALVIDKSYKSNKLLEVDILAFFAGIRLHNIITPLALNLQCTEEACQKEFKITVDLADIIENCKNYKVKELEFEKTCKEITYKFILSEPTFQNQIEFEQYMAIVEEQDLVGNKNDFRLFTTPVTYIKQVFINGEAIADWKDIDFIDKLKFYEELRGDITITTTDEDSGDSLLMQMLDNFTNTDEKLALFKPIHCPFCKQRMEGVITYDNFFII